MTERSTVLSGSPGIRPLRSEPGTPVAAILPKNLRERAGEWGPSPADSLRRFFRRIFASGPANQVSHQEIRCGDSSEESSRAAEQRGFDRPAAPGAIRICTSGPEQLRYIAT